MNLKRVTITGADDETSLSEMIDLSAEFPFVEWGILVSTSNRVGLRFPGTVWLDNLFDAAPPMNLSMHLCGSVVRNLLIGELKVRELPEVLELCGRVQINTHAEIHESMFRYLGNLVVLANNEKDSKEFIFQFDGVNNHLIYPALAHDLKVSALFDSSHGAGVLPEVWPFQDSRFPCGYAGGLGPDNVAEQVKKIEAKTGEPYWIDMERQVRTDDASKLDMGKVRRVLEICKGLIG